jgi:hypothetical protein
MIGFFQKWIFIVAVPCMGMGVLGVSMPTWAQQTQTVYRCPGNNFTNALTPKEAEKRGCKPLEGNSVTVVPGTKTYRSTDASKAPNSAGGGDTTGTQRVTQEEQRARDSDARRILENELAGEETKLLALKQEFNQGEPERRGDERNYQKYLDRVETLKAAIARKESDVNAIRRELNKLPR